MGEKGVATDESESDLDEDVVTDDGVAGVKFLNTRQAAQYLGLSPRTLENWRQAKQKERRPNISGPEFFKIGGQARYTRQALDKWLLSRITTITPRNRKKREGDGIENLQSA